MNILSNIFASLLRKPILSDMHITNIPTGSRLQEAGVLEDFLVYAKCHFEVAKGSKPEGLARSFINEYSAFIGSLPIKSMELDGLSKVKINCNNSELEKFSNVAFKYVVDDLKTSLLPEEVEIQTKFDSEVHETFEDMRRGMQYEHNNDSSDDHRPSMFSLDLYKL